MLQFPPESTIPGYRITGLIARGGMGQVYAAFDETLQREVAIKTLLPGAPALRFITEAKITARLPHLARSFAEPFAEPRPPGSLLQSRDRQGAFCRAATARKRVTAAAPLPGGRGSLAPLPGGRGSLEPTTPGSVLGRCVRPRLNPGNHPDWPAGFCR